MEDLKPCPFCGGEASVVGKPHEAKFCVGCGDDTCLGFSGLGWLYDTEEDAASAWNHRAERTCRVERVVYPDGEVEGYMCVACGYSFMPDVPNYCPECGARVEVE